MNELRDITKKRKTIGHYLKSAWYFETIIEKLVLIVLCLLGVWKILSLMGVA